MYKAVLKKDISIEQLIEIDNLPLNFIDRYVHTYEQDLQYMRYIDRERQQEMRKDEWKIVIQHNKKKSQYN